MEHFRQVLEIEKKYEQRLSLARKQIERNLEKAISDLKDEEVALMGDYKKELENSLRKEKKTMSQKGEELVESAKLEAEKIRNTPKKDAILSMLLEDLENV